MTPALMPRMRIPLWAAIGVPVAAYAVRSAVRGSMAPDLPADAIVLGSLIAVLLLSALHRSPAQRCHDELTGEMDNRHGHEGSERNNHQV